MLEYWTPNLDKQIHNTNILSNKKCLLGLGVTKILIIDYEFEISILC